MRITQVAVERLFDLYDHLVPLNSPERVTIMYGPNGYGKTTLLNLVAGLLSTHDSVLRSVPYRELRVDFDDGRCLAVRQVRNKGESPRRCKLEFSLVGSGGHRRVVAEPPNEEWDSRLFRHLLMAVSDHPSLRRVGYDTWVYTPTGETLGPEDIVDRFPDVLPRFMQGSRAMDASIRNARTSVEAWLIRAERLLRPSPGKWERDPQPFRRAVEEYADDLATVIKSKLAEYASTSQMLDRTFPKRLLEWNSKDTLDDTELQRKLDDLDRRKVRLEQVGLLAGDAGTPMEKVREFQEFQRTVLSLYVEDMSNKLTVLEPLASKIEFFAKSVNSRVLNKHMEIGSSESGAFYFTMLDGTKLPLNALSSGEQHIVVLFYELLFKARTGSLVLIDEPEISQHVAWQVEFTKDVLELAKLCEYDVLIATHSPQIVGNRWDLTVELGGGSV